MTYVCVVGMLCSGHSLSWPVFHGNCQCDSVQLLFLCGWSNAAVVFADFVVGVPFSPVALSDMPAACVPNCFRGLLNRGCY